MDRPRAGGSIRPPGAVPPARHCFIVTIARELRPGHQIGLQVLMAADAFFAGGGAHACVMAYSAGRRRAALRQRAADRRTSCSCRTALPPAAPGLSGSPAWHCRAGGRRQHDPPWLWSIPSPIRNSNRISSIEQECKSSLSADPGRPGPTARAQAPSVPGGDARDRAASDLVSGEIWGTLDRLPVWCCGR
jgi:hypothetical protein